MFTDDRLATELRRIARRLEHRARLAEALTKTCEESGARAARAFSGGSSFAFREAARMLKAEAKL